MSTKGKRVRTYWNLHKDTYSIVSAEGDDYGKVIDYADCFSLTGVKFRVQEATRQKIVDEGTRDICAYAVGQFNSPTAERVLDMYDVPISPVRFDPFTMDTFQVQRENEWQPIHETAELICETVETDSGPKPRIYTY